MPGFSCARAGENALLQLSDAPRHELACVLADWLNVYAGISPQVIRREHLEFVVELRRMLLTMDEPLAAVRSVDRAGDQEITTGARSDRSAGN